MLISDPLGEGSNASSTDSELWRAEKSTLGMRGELRRSERNNNVILKHMIVLEFLHCKKLHLDKLWKLTNSCRLNAFMFSALNRQKWFYKAKNTHKR